MTSKNKKTANQRAFASDDKKTIFLRGEYSEFKVKRTSGDIIVDDQVVDSTEMVKVTDLITNQTSYFQNVENLDYSKDLGLIPITREEPLPKSVVIDVEAKKSGIYHIDVNDLVKDQIDFNTDKFKITAVYGNGKSKVELKDNQVIFQTNSTNNEIMSFRYVFENEYGQSSTERVPVLLRTPDLPQDEKFIQQLWYLEAVNVLPVWQKYNGTGVRIGVYDSSFFPEHSDIDGNVIHRENFKTHNGNIILNQHALQVASIIAAERNDKFYVGVAYGAKIGSYQALGSDHPNHNNLDFFLEYDIINNSWCSIFPLSTPKERIKLYIQDFKAAVTEGRNELGSIIIFASGNGGGYGFDANYDGLTSGPYTVTVGGINKPAELLFMEKQTAYFAAHGANILVSAPASNLSLLSNDNFSISNNLESQDSNNLNTQGTSFAAPIVSGIVALMLQANPKLGYRDAQEILAASATFEESELLSQWAWNYNKANTWNGGGYHFSHQYGFGMVNAEAAVKLAQSWPLQQTTKNLKTIQGKYQITAQKVISTKLYEIDIPQKIITEHVEQATNIAINGNIQDVNLYLISPKGTTSKLMYNFLHNPVEQTKLSYSEISNIFKMYKLPRGIDWNFGSTNFRGEDSQGKWALKVEIINPSNPQDQPTEVYVNNLDIKIYGKEASTAKQMIYTNEYKLLVDSMQNALKATNLESEQKLLAALQKYQSITVEQKIDIINGAALSSGIEVDLDSGKLTIQDTLINLDKDLKLKAIIATDFNDSITISDDKELTITLNEGNDIINFSGYNNVITFKKQTGNISINHFADKFTLDLEEGESEYCWQLSDNYFDNNIIILDNAITPDFTS